MKFKNNKGVTLTALSVAIIIILILTSTIIYKSKNKVMMEKYDNMLIDIDSISSKIDEYYKENNAIPTICKYLNKNDLKNLINNNAQNRKCSLSYSEIVNPNDSEDEYYVIDLEKLYGLTVNYGYGSDYKKIKSSGNISSTNIENVESKIYVINMTTHQIYYPYGVILDDILYFTSDLGKSIDAKQFDVNKFNPVGFVEEETESRAVILSVWITDTENFGNEVTIKCNGESQNIDVDSYAEFVIVLNGEYDIIIENESGKTIKEKVTVTKCKIETFSEICDTNTEIEIDGYKVTIPAGFAYGVSDNIKSVNGGLVITDSVDENGNSTGNEFVWIPVDKTNLTAGNTDKKMAELSTEGGTDYKGILYNFSGTTSEKMTDTRWREPDVITDYDGKDVDTAGITKTNLQKEYNDMISSIQKYGGFYVARYETGIENGKAISKIGVMPTNSEMDESKIWYGLYSLAKTYKNTKNSVVSQMIWGSQYDAMLNFALTGNDSLKVSSTNYGNHTYVRLKTGLTRTIDKINNIYDLEGNYMEWTSEAFYVYARVERGGSSNDRKSAKDRGNDYSTRESGFISSRTTLYIK